ncbi:MAG: YggT family protein [Nitrospirales bacterium]|nr:YggT family protein [Nitrospinota bacterium]
MFAIGNILQGVAYVLDTVLFLYMWLIIIRAVISWVNPDPYNPIIQFLGRVTDPVLYTIRRRVGIIGGIDVSPILAILLIIFLQYAVVETIRDIGMRLN